METAFILVFVAFLILLSTAGWVLFLYFWARSIPRGTRSLAAALLGSAGVMGPVLMLGSGSGEELAIMLAVVALMAGIVGLPTALLANRKLERIGSESAAVFD